MRLEKSLSPEQRKARRQAWVTRHIQRTRNPLQVIVDHASPLDNSATPEPETKPSFGQRLIKDLFRQVKNDICLPIPQDQSKSSIKTALYETQNRLTGTLVLDFGGTLASAASGLLSVDLIRSGYFEPGVYIPTALIFSLTGFAYKRTYDYWQHEKRLRAMEPTPQLAMERTSPETKTNLAEQIEQVRMSLITQSLSQEERSTTRGWLTSVHQISGELLDILRPSQGEATRPKKKPSINNSPFRRIKPPL